jgi:hypothetical protein
VNPTEILSRVKVDDSDDPFCENILTEILLSDGEYPIEERKIPMMDLE